MTGFLTALLDRIVEIESGLVITEPIPATVTKAYRYFLDPQSSLPGPRVFQNEWTMQPIDPARMMTLRELTFVVRMQFIAGPSLPDAERTIDIGTSFFEAALAAFCGDVSLNGTATRALLRGEEPTLGLITRGGATYIGWEAFLDIQIRQSFNWGG